MKKKLQYEKDAITNLIRKAFLRQQYTKRSRVYKILKCDWNTLKIHIESQFDDNMNWNNRGKYGWHVDHIIPLYYAKNKKELIELNYYKNLQPLWYETNLKKGTNLDISIVNSELIELYNTIIFR